MTEIWRDEQGRTRADRICQFIESYCLVPEGALVGTPIVLAKFQKDFIYEVYDNPNKTRRGILSMARKNGKTALTAALLLAHTIGPEAKQNSQIVSGALSRDQAALVFNLASKMIQLSPVLSGLARIIPSGKKIIGLRKNVEYKALAKDGGTAQGLSPIVVILDETGQIVGPNDDFVDALTTSQGAHEEPLLLCISTQAPSDSDLLSIWIDDAIRSEDPHIVCHIHQAPKECEVDDITAWSAANPGIGIFRSRKDVEEQAKQAKRLPSAENTFRNLILNQRISLETLFMAPSVWKTCGEEPEMEVFNYATCHLGLDLSAKTDLTAAVLCAADEGGVIHTLPFVFTPMSGLEERSKRDRAPYEQWVKDGKMIALPGSVIDYTMVAEYLKVELKGMNLGFIHFDRWRADIFKKECDEVGFATDCEWVMVGQGFKDMSPRLETFEQLSLQGKIKHGNHPLLTMAAANAVAVTDPAGNRKLMKNKSSARIDPIIAMAMAVHGAASNSVSESVYEDRGLLIF